jgi:polyferredoxin
VARVAAVPPVKKAFTRRARDRSQLFRRGVQASFLLLNIWIGVQFYGFVRYFETGGQSPWTTRPPGVEGWLPIAGLMNLKFLAITGTVPAIRPAAMFLLGAFLLISFTLRKAFCSWMCPIGTISEWLWRAGTKMFGRTFDLPRWLDLPLRALKYILLGLFVFAVSTMTAEMITDFMQSPYGLITDVKMLDFFRQMGRATAMTMVVLVVGSIFVKNLWCRYLCPYGALLGLVALASPTRIRRESEACIDCALCAKACPSHLPVDRRITIRSAECTGCLECVAVCPASGALRLATGRSRAIPAWAVVAAIAVMFFGLVGYAKISGHWSGAIPVEVYSTLIPAARSVAHLP